MPELTPAEWDDFLSHHPHAHLLQTSQWGQLKAAFGWQAARLVEGQTGAQILFRPLPLGQTFAYLPKGPVGPHNPHFWQAVDELCRKKRAIFLKLEPDPQADPGPDPNPAGALPLDGASPPPGFVPSPHPIQPPRTIIVDIRGTEDQILARMKQKTRYNIRLAIRKGVVVRPSGDLDTFAALMQETGQRDRFGVHSREYYQTAFDLFQPRGHCALLVAELDHQPLAAIMVFSRGQRAWYLYGASSNQYRNYMPTYLLQWEAMRWARGQGCHSYDLWGVPDEDAQTLENEFTRRSDGLWGVYRFKRGFGGQLHRAPGPWDRVYRPALYKLYRLRMAHRA